MADCYPYSRSSSLPASTRSSRDSMRTTCYRAVNSSGSDVLLIYQALQAVNQCGREQNFNLAYEGLQRAVITLLDCEICTLFLIDARTRQLSAKLAGYSDFITLPFGAGVAGLVAETGRSMNISDSYGCKHFDPGIDLRTGFRTRNILCHPVCDVYGQRVAVIEALNKQSGAFTDMDAQMLEMFGVHLGNSLSLTRLHHSALIERQRMATMSEGFRLLQLCSPSLDGLVSSIVRTANELVKACHTLILFMDHSSNKLWTRWLNGSGCDSQGLCVHMKQLQSGLLIEAVLRKHCVCAYDVGADSIAPDFAGVLGKDRLTSVLVQPIVDARNGSILAILVAAEKAVDPVSALLANAAVFDTYDQAALGVWAIEVAGILANRSLDISFASALAGGMTDEEHLDAVLEAQLLSYIHSRHPPARADQVAHLPESSAADTGLSFEYQESSAYSSLSACMSGHGLLDSLEDITSAFSVAERSGSKTHALGKRNMLERRKDNDDNMSKEASNRSFRLRVGKEAAASQELLRWDVSLCEASYDDMLRFIYTIFSMSGMVGKFAIEEWRLNTFIACVASNYQNNPYHNLCHACYVLQATYLIVRAASASGALSPAAQLAVLIAALVHDLDHDGHTNSFHVATKSQLALCYNDTSVMENHHCAMAYSILDREDCALLSHLDRAMQQEIRRLVIGAVMATDISNHFALTSKFWQHGRIWSSSSPDESLLLAKAILHAADLSNSTRPFPINAAMSVRLYTEFKAQVQEERAAGLVPAPHMEADSHAVRCSMEASFIQAVALPVWEHLAACFPALSPAVRRMEINHDLYQALAHLGEAQIMQVYHLSESDRQNGRAMHTRWIHGEGLWRIAPEMPASTAAPQGWPQASRFSFEGPMES